MEVVHKLGLELRFDHIKKFNNLHRVLVKPSLSSNPARLGLAQMSLLTNSSLIELELVRILNDPSLNTHL
jgi:hypothetical protein